MVWLWNGLFPVRNVTVRLSEMGDTPRAVTFQTAEPLIVALMPVSVPRLGLNWLNAFVSKSAGALSEVDEKGDTVSVSERGAALAQIGAPTVANNAKVPNVSLRDC